MRRNTRQMEPGQTVSGGGWSGMNESADTMRRTLQHADSNEHDVYVNYGSCRGVEWRERPVFDYPMPVRRRGRR